MSNVRPDASTDEIIEDMREICNMMTRNRDEDTAADLGAALADLVKELDDRMSAGEPLPQVWRQGR